MSKPKPLFDLNPALDVVALAARFAGARRVQVEGLLTLASADNLHDVLAHQTDWGLGWHGGVAAPGAVRGEALRAMAPEARLQLGGQAALAARSGQFAFRYGRYPMLDAYKERWDPGHPLDLVLEYINAAPLLELVRAVTGDMTLVKADAQATLFAPGHFLTSHDDSDEGEGRRIAYVLGMTREWRVDWGGYLLFHDAGGDIVAGYRPKFNVLNLFAVPQHHSVSYVAPFAPVGRFAITGWFRDR